MIDTLPISSTVTILAAGVILLAAGCSDEKTSEERKQKQQQRELDDLGRKSLKEFEKGVDALNSGRPLDAIPHLSLCIDFAKQSYEKCPNAHSDVRECLDIVWDITDGHSVRAKCYFNLNEWNECISDCNSVEHWTEPRPWMQGQQNTRWTEILWMRGYAYHKSGRVDLATADFRRLKAQMGEDRDKYVAKIPAQYRP